MEMTTEINIKYMTLWYHFENKDESYLYIVVPNNCINEWLYYVNNLNVKTIEHYDNFKKVYKYELSEDLKCGYSVLKFKHLTESEITEYHKNKKETAIYFGYEFLTIKTEKKLYVLSLKQVS